MIQWTENGRWPFRSSHQATIRDRKLALIWPVQEGWRVYFSRDPGAPSRAYHALTTAKVAVERWTKRMGWS